MAAVLARDCGVTLAADLETLTGGSAADAITLSAAVSGMTIRLGAGADSLVLADGANTLTIGSIETVLAGRPGSWEADAVRNLLTATVGPDEQQLL